MNRRLLTEGQVRALWQAIRTRDQLTNKALAALLGLTEQQIASQIRALRSAEFEPAKNL